MDIKVLSVHVVLSNSQINAFLFLCCFLFPDYIIYNTDINLESLKLILITDTVLKDKYWDKYVSAQ